MSATPPSAAESPTVPSAAVSLPRADDEPTLEIDELCIQVEHEKGHVRARFVPASKTCYDVCLTFFERLEGETDSDRKEKFKKMPPVEMIEECAASEGLHSFEIPVPSFDHANHVVFNVMLQFERDGRKSYRCGTWTADVVKDTIGSKRERANHIVMNIGSNITCDRASEVKNSYDVKGLLETALKQSDEEFERQFNGILHGKKRAYKKCDLARFNIQSELPPQPAAAKVDRLTLDFGAQRLLLFSSPTVTFGRRRELCDIFWRHPYAERIAPDDPAHNDYKKISRRQCLFEHRGDKVALVDGGRDEQGRVMPSSYGTNYNAVRIDGEKFLAADATDTGLITFSDSAATGMLSVCVPGDVCAKCTRADRRWCANGRRPSLVFKRLDGAPETAVMVWSCFRLEEVVPSFEGVKIFCENGGFAWRRGRHCGWLVPGESIETENGLVSVCPLPSPMELGKKNDDVRNP